MIGVAVIGFGWMGQVHARAYERVRHHYPELAQLPQLITVADSEAERLADARASFHPDNTTRDWRQILTDDRVGAVSVTAPNFLHREIGTAVAAAGKHLWIEKPVGVTSADARAVAEAVVAAGVHSSVGFNYRNVPAVEWARELIASSEIGRVTNASFQLCADYAAHPLGALSWRFDTARGGHGVLDDLVSHGVDLAHYLVGAITEVVADTAMFITQRPLPSRLGTHFAIEQAGALSAVENEDYLGCLVRFADGARGGIMSSRVSVGDQCNYGFTIHGTNGFVAWDFRRMGELVLCAGSDYLNQPTRTIYVDPNHGELGRFQPAAGIAMSYDDLKVVEAARFLTSIAEDEPRGATIVDAARTSTVLGCMVESAASRRWVTVPNQ